LRLLAAAEDVYRGGSPHLKHRACWRPVFKRGDASLANIYPLISLKETPRKLYDATLIAAFEEDGILVQPEHPFWNGFRSRRSTGDAIIALQEMIMVFNH
jgi:hypothetical protein